MNIGIITATGSNLTSLENTLKGHQVKRVSQPEEAMGFDALILPGVGHASAAMKKIEPWFSFLKESTQPILGICVGMQILFSYLEESKSSGLSLLQGAVKEIPLLNDGPVPHMGWNQVKTLTNDTDLFSGLSGASFYFIHSYACPVISPQTQASFNYNGQWSAVVQERNFTGVQFHPEKSGSAGQRFINNYLETIK